MSKNDAAKRREKVARRGARKDKVAAKVARRHRGVVAHDEASHAFWLAHGANFLASSYGEGTWTPLFADIYGEGAKVPSSTVLRLTVFKLYHDAQTQQWTDEGRSIASWIAQDPVVTTIVSRRAAKAATTAEAALEPRNPNVWALFAELGRGVLRGAA